MNVMEMEKIKFLQTLHHDKKGGQMIRLRIDENGSEQRSYCDIADVAATGTDTAAYYVSVNTFRGYKRESAKVFNFESIYIDIDCHKSDDLSVIETTKAKVLYIMQQSYEAGTLAIPTMVTDTGRGLGLQYCLNQSIANTWRAEKMVSFFKKVRKFIFEKYKDILAGEDMVEVDGAVLDDARVCRLPGTYNVKAGKYCRLISVSGKFYELSELVQKCHLWDWKPEEEYKKVKEEKERKKRAAAKPIVSFAEYRLPFLSIRLEQLEKLQELRGENCAGCREQLLFIAYSALKQLDPANAALRLQEMNKRFEVPLPQTELDHIVQETDQSVGIDHSGFYKLSNSYVIDTLGLTDAEIKTLGIGHGLKRSAERRGARDKKMETRKKVVELLTQADSLTYDQIAETVGMSRRTICTIAKAEGLMRYAKAAERQNSPEKKAEIIAIDSVQDGEHQAAESANFATESVCVDSDSSLGELLSTLVRGAGGEDSDWYEWLTVASSAFPEASELLKIYAWSGWDSAPFGYRLENFLDRQMPSVMAHPETLTDLRDSVAHRFFRHYKSDLAYFFGVYNVAEVLPTVWALFTHSGTRPPKKRYPHPHVNVNSETSTQRETRINRYLKEYHDSRFDIIEDTDEYRRRLDPAVIRTMKVTCMQVGRLKRDFFWIEKKKVLTSKIKECFNSLTYKDIAVICGRMAHQGTIQEATTPFYYVLQTVWKYRHPEAAEAQADRIKGEKPVNRFNNFESRTYDFDIGKFLETNAVRRIMGEQPLSKEEFINGGIL